MRFEDTDYKLPMVIKCLVLCTTEKEDKPRPATIKKLDPTKAHVEPNQNELEPGYLGCLPDKILYRIFSTNPPFVWQKEVIEWCQKFLPVNQIRKIKVKTKNLDAIKWFCKYLISHKQKNPVTLILSKESYRVLRKKDPKFLEKIQPFFIPEKEDTENQLKTKKAIETVAERIIRMSQSTTITPLERKIYLFFLGRNLKGVNSENTRLLIFDYNLIANELIGCLKVSKREIRTSIDRLKKKGIIRIIVDKQLGSSFFMVSDDGPVDLVPSVLGDPHGN